MSTPLRMMVTCFWKKVSLVVRLLFSSSKFVRLLVALIYKSRLSHSSYTDLYRGAGLFFLGAISLGRTVLPSYKIVINISRTYEKLPCKGEPFVVSEILRYKQIDRQTSCYFIISIMLISGCRRSIWSVYKLLWQHPTHANKTRGALLHVLLHVCLL